MVACCGSEVEGRGGEHGSIQHNNTFLVPVFSSVTEILCL